MATQATAGRGGGGGDGGGRQQDPTTVLLGGDLHCPLVGLGTYKLSSADGVATALELGYRLVDCAPVYDNEKVVGEGLKSFLQQGRRHELVIVSKVWNDAHRPAELRRSVELSLADLGCGQLDICLLHWPDAWKPGTQEADDAVTLRETWAAMEALVDDGLARHIGVSNFNLAQVEELVSWARIQPVCNQVELHPMLAQHRLVDGCQRLGVFPIAYGPLGHGKGGLLDHPVVAQVAQAADKTPAEVLLRWNVQRGVPVIPKAGSEPHLRSNLQGLFGWQLTPDQQAQLDALDSHTRFVNNSWHDWGDATDGPAAA